MPQAEADVQTMVDTLRTAAQGLIAKGAFGPFGASISTGGELVIEYVPPAASGFGTRKALHHKLVQIAKSGQARAVAICHSLENPAGAYLVISADHAQGKPVTYLYLLQEEGGREQVAAEPIVQQAAYTFFGFVDVPAAQRTLPGKWTQEAGHGAEPDEVTYRPDNRFQRTGQTGLWAVDEGDFYTNLVEFARGADTPTHVARIIELSQERMLLHEVSGGVVTALVYWRSG